MDNKKIRYAKIPRYSMGTKLPKYGDGTKNKGFDGSNNNYGQALAGIGMTAAGMGGAALSNSSYQSDGHVNADSYAGGKVLSDAAAGASLGSTVGPWGTLVGGVVGAGYGAISGSIEAGDINAKADDRTKAIAIQKQQMEKDKQDNISKQRDAYSRSYINQNPISGQQGASIYAFGTGEGSPATGITPNVTPNYNANVSNPTMNQKQWDDYNIKKGYLPVDNQQNKIAHKTYYNPNEYVNEGLGGFKKIQDKGQIVNYNNDNTYQPFMDYKGVVPQVVNAPTGHATSNRKAIGFDTNSTTYKYDDGRTATFDKSGQEIKPLTYSYAYGTKGGSLKPLASGIEKAEGNTHEQGGIELSEEGKPFAEIEDKEIMVDDDKILSNRLPFHAGKTFADEGESLGHEKAEYEKHLTSSDIFKRNTAKRNLEKLDNKMNTLLKYQDVVRKNLDLDDTSPVNKKAYGGMLPKYWDGGKLLQSEDRITFNSRNDRYNRQKSQNNEGRFSPPLAEDDGQSDVTVPGNEQRANNFSNVLQGEDGNNSMNNNSTNPNTNKRFNGQNIANGLMNAIPYIDNIANSRLIKQTPEIPTPTNKVAMDEMVMPMQTKYDISGALNESNRDVNTFNKNILDNTSSSNTARGNLASGLAAKIANNNQLYTQKTNAENQLQNANAMNQQAVNARNVGNRQNILNENSGQTDKYNWNNMLRKDDMRTQTSANVQNATNDAIHGVQDKRTGDLDKQRILYDSVKYSDGAGLATMIGSKEMDEISKDPEARIKILSVLRKSGRNAEADKYAKQYKME